MVCAALYSTLFCLLHARLADIIVLTLLETISESTVQCSTFYIGSASLMHTLSHTHIYVSAAIKQRFVIKYYNNESLTVIHVHLHTVYNHYYNIHYFVYIHILSKYL